MQLNSSTLSRALWFYPPVDSVPFHQITPHGGVLVAGGTNNQVLISFAMPPNSWGILKGFGITCALPVGFSNLQWSVRVNTVPIPGYANFCDQISDLIHLNYLFFKLNESDVVDIVVSSILPVGGQAYVTYARLVGWYETGDTIDDLTQQLDAAAPAPPYTKFDVSQ